MACVSALHRIDLDRLRDFILQRQKPDGCFATAPSLPSTVADTWYGVALCCLLDALDPESAMHDALDRKKILLFVRRHDALRQGLPLRILYFLSALERYATGKWPGLPESLAARFNGHSLDCVHFFYLRRLFPRQYRRVRVSPPDLGHATCRDIFFCLQGGVQGNSVMGAWLCRCQNDDGGFGFFPGTTSYMEYCDYALSALHLLGREPLSRQRAEDFIVHCQAGNGGFARAIRALPFLESSWHAMHALAVPARIKVKNFPDLSII